VRTTICNLKIYIKFDKVTAERDNTEELYIALASHKYKFDKVTAERDNTEELYIALASHKYIEDNHS
jgi:hypothetical protein